MKYPKTLTPGFVEFFNIEGSIVEIPKSVLTFDKWDGQPIKETFGGKPIVCFNDKPMFAELAIMNHFVSDGWNARWIETYGKSKDEPIFLTEWMDDKYRNQIHQPILDVNIKKVCEDIKRNNSNSYSGCWDVLGWIDDTILFVESKRLKKDRVRQTQNNWLAAALKCGLSPDNFLIVQWDII